MCELPKRRIDIFDSFLLLALCLLAVTAGACSREKNFSTVVAPEGYRIPRRIQYGFTVQNETGQLVEKGQLWTFAPVKLTATQWCEQVDASHPFRLISDRLGNQVLRITLPGMPPYASRIITIRVKLLLAANPNAVEGEDAGVFLHPGLNIESNDPRLVSLAQSLRKGRGNSSPERFFHWITGNIRYDGYAREDRGALQCLNRKAGDCTEQMYLFAALCRVAGIPARGMAGYVCDGDRILRAADYHNWAEFQKDGVWRIADPQQRTFMANPSRYIAMRVLASGADEETNPLAGYHRFRVEGEGLKVKMNP